MPPLPTTAVNTPAYPIQEPHGETHETDGIDPILGPIRYLGAVSLTSTFSTTSTSFVDNGLELDVKSRGGQLFILASGPRKATDSTASTGIGAGIRTRAMVDGSALDTYVERFDTIADGATTLDETGVWHSGTFIWLYDTDAGDHTVKIQIRNDNGSSAEFPAGEGDAILIVFELLPIRRG